MPAITGAAIAALGVFAVLLVYVLTWRATRESSATAKVFLRGGFAALVAALIVGGSVVSLNLRQDATAPMALPPPQPQPPRDQSRQERLPAEQLDASQADRARPDYEQKQQQPLPESFGQGAPTPEPLGGGAAPPASVTDAKPNLAQPPLPSAAAVPPAEQTPWDVVPVFYGTDREEEPNAKRVSYNSERGRRLALGRALVTVPKIHEVPQIERPWALRIPYFDVTIYEVAEDPKKHFTMQEIRKLTEAEFVALARERLAGSQRYKDHALVFVHGYNTSFDHAIYRTAQIAYDIKFDGAAFAYSWPSGGGVASYTYDRESAGAAQPYLRQFLDLVVKQSGAKSISVIAHSMGNQPLLEVLKDMKSAAPPGVVISQVILAAPDVDADNFTNLASTIQGFARGVTLYAASNDRALIISRNFWRNPRAGDVPASGPLIVPGIDSIDVTAASTDAFALNHSGYAENNDLLQDIGRLILEGLRPPDQRLANLLRVTNGKGDYWRYIKQP
jgi:esterase/lipase superfamily enzyme